MALDANGERLAVEELDGLRLVCDPQDSERPTKRLVRLVKLARQLGGLPAAVQVRLLCGPGCPLVDDAWAALARALRRIDVPSRSRRSRASSPLPRCLSTEPM
jgi:hypothetical protein